MNTSTADTLLFILVIVGCLTLANQLPDIMAVIFVIIGLIVLI